MPRELSYDWDKLVKIVKQDDEITQRAAAEKLGVSPSSLSILNFCQAKVEAGVESTAPATAKSVKDLRDRQGYRWEMIMAKTDLSKSDVMVADRHEGWPARVLRRAGTCPVRPQDSAPRRSVRQAARRRTDSCRRTQTQPRSVVHGSWWDQNSCRR
jgi:hypothetical protein